MTREYILENLETMCPIMFIDNPGLRDHVMATLQDSILISKPKFKRGDVVYNKTELDPYYGPEAFKINSTFYNIEEGTYYYTRIPADHIFAEYDLDYYIEKKEESK